MTEDEWNAGWVRCLGLRLSGRTLNDVNEEGEVLKDDTYLICLNPHHQNIPFRLPDCTKSCTWELLIDTRNATSGEAKRIAQNEPYDLLAHSALVLREAPTSTSGG
jgi:glycogen operon protein